MYGYVSINFNICSSRIRRVKQGLPWKAGSCSATKEICVLVWHLEILRSVHTSCQLSEIRPVHTSCQLSEIRPVHTSCQLSEIRPVHTSCQLSEIRPVHTSCQLSEIRPLQTLVPSDTLKYSHHFPFKPRSLTWSFPVRFSDKASACMSHLTHTLYSTHCQLRDSPNHIWAARNLAPRSEDVGNGDTAPPRINFFTKWMGDQLYAPVALPPGKNLRLLTG
jgi:hypothetical protein